MLSRRDAKYAIESGAWYMALLRATWRARGRAVSDKHDLALASYNAGTGSILKAQALCDGAAFWREISPCLADVTGNAHAAETRDYVAKSHRWFAEMERL